MGAWEEMIDTTPIPPTAAFKSIIVPTVDTVRYLFLADVAIRNGAQFSSVDPRARVSPCTCRAI